MKANSAALFVLLGIAIWSAPRAGSRYLQAACAWGVIGVAAATVAEYAFAVDLQIDEALFHDTPGGSSPPGRMAPATAIDFLLMGVAVLLLDRRPITSGLCALGAAVVSFIALCGYFYGASSLYRIGPYSSMALHTAWGFLASAAALLLARPGEGFTSILAANTAAGTLLRRLLPAMVIVPLGLGWLRLRGEEAGLYDTAFGVAIMTVGSVGILTAVVGLIASSLHRTEMQHRKDEQALRDGFQRFRALIAASAQIVWSMTANGEVVEDSPTWREFTGQTFGELRGLGWLKAIHPDDREGVAALGRNAIDTGATVETEYRVRHVAGDWRWTKARAIPMMGADGAVRGWVGMNTDITDHKRSESERIQLFEQLQALKSEVEARPEIRSTEPAN